MAQLPPWFVIAILAALAAIVLTQWDNAVFSENSGHAIIPATHQAVSCHCTSETHYKWEFHLTSVDCHVFIADLRQFQTQVTLFNLL